MTRVESGRCRSVRVAATLLALLAYFAPGGALDSTHPVIASSERPELTTRIRRAIDTFNAATAFPLPSFSDERLKDLYDGNVVRIHDKWQLPNAQNTEHQSHRVLAFRLARASRLAVWLSALDPHFALNDRITEVRVRAEGSNSTWYQFMALPWPITDRHG